MIQEDTHKIPVTLQFTDIGTPGQEPWIAETVTEAVRHGLIKNKNRDIRPHDYVTRGEAL